MKRPALPLALLLLTLSACRSSDAPLTATAPQPSAPTPEEPALLEPPSLEAPVGQWLAGDMHVHSDHSSDGSGLRQGLEQRGPGNVSVADQIGQGALSGLAWMPLTDHRTYDQHYDPLWESDQLLLLRGEEANGSPHANPIGAVDMIVQGGTPEGRPDYAKLQTSIWDAHSQGAAWQHNHPDDGHLNDDGTPNERAYAVGADLMEVWNKGSDIAAELAYAESRWNRGYRFGASGAGDNHFRELWNVAGPGNPATHVFSRDYTERGLVQGLLAGRTVINARVAFTPFISLEADLQKDGIYEAIAGDELVAAAGTAGKLRVNVSNALTNIGATLSIYKSPGRAAGAFQNFTVTAGTQSFEAEISAEDGPTWYYAELRGVGEVDAINTGATDDPLVLIEPSIGSDERRAITSPIFIGTTLAEAEPEQPLPADSGGDDGARLLLGYPGRFSGFPDLAASGAVTHLVAEQHEEARTTVHYRRSDADGTADPVDLVPGSSSARFPKIAARGDDVYVVWQDQRSGQIPYRTAIYLRHSADGGRSWEPEQKIRESAGRSEKPDIALRPDGKPVLVWQEISAGNPFDIFAQVLGEDAEPANLTRSGKTVMAANLIDTRSARYPASVWPSVAVRADGLVAIAYQDNRTDPDPLWTGAILTGEDGATEVDNWQVQVVTRRDAGAWSAPAAFGNDQRADRHPVIGFSRDHTLVVLWDSKTLDAAGANLSIRYSTSGDDGQTWADAADPPALAEDAGTMAQYPGVGTNLDGSLRAVWYDSRSADWRWRVMTASYDQGWGEARLINSRGVNTWPATDGGQIAFASTRHAQRLQRDRTQQIFLLKN